MDLVRSCYKTAMKFFPDNPIEIPVRWFFCDPTATIFPGRHGFGSGNWASPFAKPGLIGESTSAPRPWVDGSPPIFLPPARVPGFSGVKFSGPEEVYRAGVEYPGVPVGGVDSGQCNACFRLPPDPCSEVRQFLPDVVYVQIAAVDNPYSPPSGRVGQIFTFRKTGGSSPYDLYTGPLIARSMPDGDDMQCSLVCYSYPFIGTVFSWFSAGVVNPAGFDAIPWTVNSWTPPDLVCLNDGTPSRLAGHLFPPPLETWHLRLIVPQ